MRKMGRRVGGRKAELEERHEDVFNTNDRGWVKRGSQVAGDWNYLASGSQRDVQKGTYSKGPRKGQACVSKEFRSGSVYESSFFTDDIKATKVVGNIIQSFNKLQPSKMVYLNEPEVWSNSTPDSAGRKAQSLHQGTNRTQATAAQPMTNLFP